MWRNILHAYIEWRWTSRLWQVSHRDTCIRVSTDKPDKRLMHMRSCGTLHQPNPLRSRCWLGAGSGINRLRYVSLFCLANFSEWPGRKRKNLMILCNPFVSFGRKRRFIFWRKSLLFLSSFPTPFILFIYPFCIFISIHHFFRAPLPFFSFAFLPFLFITFLRLSFISFVLLTPSFLPCSLPIRYVFFFFLLSVFSIFILPHI